jgi:hypothetical protein
VTDDLIFVCQAPGSSGRNDAPLAGACGQRLASRCGFDPSALLARERVNLIPYFPGRAGKGHKFPLGMARRAADALAPSLARRRAMFVGLGVARAFGHSRPLGESFSTISKRLRHRWATRSTSGTTAKPGGSDEIHDCRLGCQVAG